MTYSSNPQWSLSFNSSSYYDRQPLGLIFGRQEAHIYALSTFEGRKYVLT
jgi:hypothetical protein